MDKTNKFLGVELRLGGLAITRGQDDQLQSQANNASLT